MIGAIPLLVDLLGCGNEDIVIKSLGCLDILTKTEKSIKIMTENGVVPILTSYFFLEPENINNNVLLPSGYILLRLLDNIDARKDMVKANYILGFIPLIVINTLIFLFIN